MRDEIMKPCDAELINGVCSGHLGKFGDCHTRALWEIALSENNGCGDSDFEGYAWPVIVEKPQAITLPDGGPTVRVQPGAYVVWELIGDAVVAGRYDTDTAAREAYATHESRYGAWEHGCNPRDLPGHQVCKDYDSCMVPWV